MCTDQAVELYHVKPVCNDATPWNNYERAASEGLILKGLLHIRRKKVNKALKNSPMRILFQIFWTSFLVVLLFFFLFGCCACISQLGKHRILA